MKGAYRITTLVFKKIKKNVLFNREKILETPQWNIATTNDYKFYDFNVNPGLQAQSMTYSGWV